MTMTLEELNAAARAERDRLNGLISSFLRKEKNGDFIISWGIQHRWANCEADRLYFQNELQGDYFPFLVAAAPTGSIRIDRAPGTVISRYGEIKTALELWAFGKGPWPEPKEEGTGEPSDRQG